MSSISAHITSQLINCAVSAALLAACSPDKNKESDSNGEMAENSGSTTLVLPPTSDSGNEECPEVHPSTNDCCCFSSAVSQDTHDVQIYNSCPSEELCPKVGVHCSPYDLGCPANYGIDNPMADFFVDDESALDCVLVALRDGTPGKISWGVNEEDQFQYTETSYIRQDRIVFTHRRDQDDFDIVYSDVSEKTLLPSAMFSSCLEATELRNKVKCLKEITTGSVTTVCAMGAQLDNL